ncbi:SRPBCC family protein [Rhodococcus sp. BP-252]|uniref:SRPBCC family protein n=1 Tax=unclassified Rhodococcus (in: high G+C Gram-positive bacteria) TaxID=192944 RepID=UPI001C9AB326|nr:MULTISPECIES: SRPBCC family protein [unclassified Rhodococcus (in: high G+C Gram-positive bacteria)]MBY6414349.1 SRPBCC family protein [Rhodococcus sp. BP-320]MBY6419119.1 SRPBCC family protein [Rhodococcus sp. BP-321]MBY6423790.1 SRPBCC family protein [Rhodococcus sp. BP-324]MBY6429174.1 SRPBCC family protein [Rhodococcus sp. BP-323]MBY6434159.1 SRPBCC family protein [Rhodococcus sp. BP-322]
MATVSVRQEFAQSPSALWAVVGDPAAAASWIPSLGSATMEGDVRHGVFTDGNPVRERIVAHDDENRTYTYEYVDGPLPLAKYVSTIRVDAAGSGSVVSWDAEFTASGDAPAALEKDLESGIGDIYRAALDEAGRLAQS